MIQSDFKKALLWSSPFCRTTTTQTAAAAAASLLCMLGLLVTQKAMMFGRFTPFWQEYQASLLWHFCLLAFTQDQLRVINIKN